jgi:hypothetical protein
MRGAVMYGPGDVRVEEREEPRIVEEVGSEVTTIKPGQFVVGSFWASDNTSEICRAGYQSACVNRAPMGMLGRATRRPGARLTAHCPGTVARVRSPDPRQRRRSPMTVLVVQHKVRDFDAWKLVFDEDESRRREHGAQRHWVYRTVEDPDDVVVAVEFPSVDAARSFVEDPGLREAMGRAGVQGEPHVHVRDEVEAIEY